MVAAAVYTGGLALGAWGGAAAAGGGAATGTVGSLAAAETVGTAAATSAMPTLVATGGTALNVAGTVPGASTAGSLAAAETVGTAAATSAMPTAPGFLSTVGEFGNTLLDAGKSVANYASENPLLASTALQGLGAALTPSPGEDMLALENARADQEKNRWNSLTESSKLDMRNLYEASKARTGYLQRT
jgi:hypothetical protein